MDLITYSLGADQEEQGRLLTQQQLYDDAKYLQFKPGIRLGEIGCGSGANLWLAEHSSLFIGMDYQIAQLEACRERARALNLKHVYCIEADARQLPLFSNSLDGCFCRLVLIHIANPQDVINEMYRILRPGGKAIAIEPDVTAWRTSKPYLFKCFTRRINFIYEPHHGAINIASQLKKAFTQAGFTSITHQRHDVEATGKEKEKLKALLTNWYLLNKPMMQTLIQHEVLTHEDFAYAEQELKELGEEDSVYQRLWIAEGIKPI